MNNLAALGLEQAKGMTERSGCPKVGLVNLAHQWKDIQNSNS